MKEDQELVKLVLAGDMRAFEELVRRYEAGILRFTYNMVRSKESAEDITQEVFIAAYNKLYTFKQQYKFSTWLYQIARNKCIDYGRKYGNVQSVNLDYLNLPSREMSPENIVEFKETKRKVEDFIATLSDIDRQILILRYSYEQLTFGDIAEIIKLGESAVKKRYYKIYDRYEEFIEKNKCGESLKKVLDI